ncbi:MAG: hypothetical protein WBV94_24855 [Blastocatellia bacterium]
MSGLKITRLKLTAAAAVQLADLGLSLADLSFVLCFARKTKLDESQTYSFDIERVPAEIRTELQHLVGIEVHIVSRAIISAARLSLNETSAHGSLSCADHKAEEEKQ